jgi:hypothetical protein
LIVAGRTPREIAEDIGISPKTVYSHRLNILRKVEKLIDKEAQPLPLYFDLDDFSPADIADILAFLSELYADLGGDGLIIDDVTLLDFQPALVPVEV